MQVNNILSYYTEIQQLKKGQMCRPRFADLHTSNRCNHNCIGCAYKGELNNKIIDEQKHDKIIDGLIRFGVKAFDFAGGGEPLMIPYIDNMFNRIKKANCHYGVITNGSKLNDELINQIINQAAYIRISLEASCIKDYCKYKQVNSKEWYNVLENVEKLVNAKTKNETNCDIGIKFSVGKSLNGINHYRQGILLGQNLGVSNVQFKSFRHEPEELTLREKEIENKICSKVFKETKTSFNLRKWIVPFNGNTPQCWLNPLHVVVDYLGNIYVCCYYYYRYSSHRIGNIFDTPIEELWYSKKHRELISSIDKNECSKVDCKFFYHHETVDRILKEGKHEFL